MFLRFFHTFIIHLKRGQCPSSQMKPIVVSGCSSVRSMFPSPNPIPLAIISIRLKGTRRDGDVPRMVFEQIAPYYPVDSPALFHAIEFNLGKVAGVRKYSNDIDKLLTLLQPSASTFCAAVVDLNTLSRYHHYVFFVTTRSTPDDGWLWHIPEGKGSVSPKQVIQYAQ